MVRAGDYGRFLCIQLAQPPLRPALYALTAFYLEMKRIPPLVNEAVAGFMRYAWWREALDEIASGNPARHQPVLQALAPLATTHPAAFAQCFRIIESFQHALEADTIHPAMQQHASYALDESWRIMGAEKSLQALPLVMENGAAKPIGPMCILRLICLGLRNS